MFVKVSKSNDEKWFDFYVNTDHIISMHPTNNSIKIRDINWDIYLTKNSFTKLVSAIGLNLHLVNCTEEF